LTTKVVSEKSCTRCGDTKPTTEFYARKDTKSGFASHCKSCVGERHKRHYEANADRIRERHRNWWAADPERARDCRRRSVIKNREQRKLYAREYRKRHPEKGVAVTRRWQEKNPEATRELRRRGGQARRARARDAIMLPFTSQQLDDRWAYYGGKCWMCGDHATQTDHVKPLSKGGAHMLCNLRPACLTCNVRKRDAWPLAKVLERMSA
jgi:hypothetical protein